MGGRGLQGRGAGNPDWFQNLASSPEAVIEVNDEKIPVRATTAQGAERDRLWSLMTAAWPAYGDYQARTEREIAVAVL